MREVACEKKKRQISLAFGYFLLTRNSAIYTVLQTWFPVKTRKSGLFIPAPITYCPPVHPWKYGHYPQVMQLQFSLMQLSQMNGAVGCQQPKQQLLLGAVGPSEGDLTRSSCVHTILLHHWYHQIQASIISHLNHYSNLLATLLLLFCFLQFIFHAVARIIILKLETNFIIF